MSYSHCPSCGEKAGGGFFNTNYLYQCRGCGKIVCSKCVERGFIKTTCPHCDEKIDLDVRLDN